MKELDLFLKALSNRLGSNRGLFVPKSSCIPSKFPAIKTYTLEIWLIKGTDITMINQTSITSRAVEESEKEKINKDLIITTIENMLKQYGI